MVRKTFNITDELDALLKEARKMLDCTEANIIKNALLLYLRKILK